jgi:hypothetical protein
MFRNGGTTVLTAALVASTIVFAQKRAGDPASLLGRWRGARRVAKEGK